MPQTSLGEWSLSGRSKYERVYAVWACEGHTAGSLYVELRQDDDPEDFLSNAIRSVQIVAPAPTPTPTPTPAAIPVPIPVPQPVPVDPPDLLEPPLAKGRPCRTAFPVRPQNDRSDWRRDEVMDNGVQTASMSVMYASFKYDGQSVVEISGGVGQGYRPPDSPELPTGPGIKCAFGWVATATSHPETGITVSGRYYYDRDGSLVAGSVAPSVSCTDDECSLRGELFEFPLGLAEFNMYMLGSHSISSDGQTLSFQRSKNAAANTNMFCGIDVDEVFVNFRYVGEEELDGVTTKHFTGMNRSVPEGHTVQTDWWIVSATGFPAQQRVERVQATVGYPVNRLVVISKYGGWGEENVIVAPAITPTPAHTATSPPTPTPPPTSTPVPGDAWLDPDPETVTFDGSEWREFTVRGTGVERIDLGVNVWPGSTGAVGSTGGVLLRHPLAKPAKARLTPATRCGTAGRSGWWVAGRAQ